MATPKPSKTIDWATDGAAKVAEPLLAKKIVGWIKEKPPLQWWNWLLRQIEFWLVWLRDIGMGNDIPNIMADDATIEFGERPGNLLPPGIIAPRLKNLNEHIIVDLSNVLSQFVHRPDIGGVITADPAPDSGSLANLVDNQQVTDIQYDQGTTPQSTGAVDSIIFELRGDSPVGGYQTSGWIPVFSLRNSTQAARDHITSIKIEFDEGGGFVEVAGSPFSPPVGGWGAGIILPRIQSVGDDFDAVRFTFNLDGNVLADDLLFEEFLLHNAGAPSVGLIAPTWREHQERLDDLIGFRVSAVRGTLGAKIEAGRLYRSSPGLDSTGAQEDNYIDFAGNTLTLDPSGIGVGDSRVDLIEILQDGTAQIVQGVAATTGTEKASGHQGRFIVAEITLDNAQTELLPADIEDTRPILVNENDVRTFTTPGTAGATDWYRIGFWRATDGRGGGILNLSITGGERPAEYLFRLSRSNDNTRGPTITLLHQTQIGELNGIRCWNDPSGADPDVTWIDIRIDDSDAQGMNLQWSVTRDHSGNSDIQTQAAVLDNSALPGTALPTMMDLNPGGNQLYMGVSGLWTAADPQDDLFQVRDDGIYFRGAKLGFFEGGTSVNPAATAVSGLGNSPGRQANVTFLGTDPPGFSVTHADFEVLQFSGPNVQYQIEVPTGKSPNDYIWTFGIIARSSSDLAIETFRFDGTTVNFRIYNQAGTAQTGDWWFSAVQVN